MILWVYRALAYVPWAFHSSEIIIDVKDFKTWLEMKRRYLFMLCTVFLCCCLKLLSRASQNVLSTPYLQCNKITWIDYYAEFIWHQQFAILNRFCKAFHFTKLIKSKTIKWWVAFIGVMVMPSYRRWAFPHTQALSVDCEKLSNNHMWSTSQGEGLVAGIRKVRQSPKRSYVLLGRKEAGRREICSLNKYSVVTIYCLDMFLVIIFRIILMAYTTLKGRQAIFMSIKRQHFSQLKNTALEHPSVHWLN